MATVKELTARVEALELQYKNLFFTMKNATATVAAPKKSAANNYIAVVTLASFEEASALLKEKYNDAKHFVSGCTVCERK